MNSSIFLAKVFSIYFVIIGLALILKRDWFQGVIAEIHEKTTAAKAHLFLISILTVIIGILLVVAHPDFTPDWQSIISVLAWLTLIKGVLLIFFPEKMCEFKYNMISNVSLYYILSIICIGLGLYLGYQGFFVILK